MNEVWKQVVGDVNYLVSNLGRVYSVSRIDSVGRKQGDVFLTPTRSGGYAYVGISGRKRAVHTLVLEAFVSPRPVEHQACHLNDDGMDNRLENLRWGTALENAADRARNGGYQRKPECVNGHRFTPENTWFTREGWQQCRECHRERSRVQNNRKAPGHRHHRGASV